MNVQTVSDRIRQDYATFPHNQSYDLYDDAVYFQDPLNRFTGIDRYQRMIGFIARWFQSPQLVLHDLTIQSDTAFQTRWTLSWVAPVPWRPAMAISGWTDYRLNADGKITSHIDQWETKPWAVVLQLLGQGKIPQISSEKP
ncbi:MAG: DUF2358 domain-containing protein [Leptolyngbyaceae cyanobacterium T60_A2020_046]|nr:DUF2358 domain-containing protein [Leptolyngbyaceae cyanobacterium T60_A2020_046]